MQVQQAIFTSACTERSEGYQLVASSRGLEELDARAVATWSPSHDGLLEGAMARGGPAASVNFYQLPSGAWCVARTRPAGQEYSDRGGPRLLTHCLVAGAETLGRFANNPFALLRAALAGGALDVPEPLSRELPALRLPGRSRALDVALVERIAGELQPRRIACFIEAALSHERLGMVDVPGAERLLACLLNCLPVECRPEMTFCSGLRFSAQRPFRLSTMAREERRRLESAYGLRCFELAAAEDLPRGWAAYVEDCLEQGGLPTLAAQLARPRPGLTLDDLPRLAAELRQESGTDRPHHAGLVQAHAAHGGHGGGPPQRQLSRPALRLEVPDVPEGIARLGALDDAIYESLTGHEGALEKVQGLWTDLVELLDDDRRDAAREQYLAYALSLRGELEAGLYDPEMALTVLDLLCVLFTE